MSFIQISPEKYITYNDDFEVSYWGDLMIRVYFLENNVFILDESSHTFEVPNWHYLNAIKAGLDKPNNVYFPEPVIDAIKYYKEEFPEKFI